MRHGVARDGTARRRVRCGREAPRVRAPHLAGRRARELRAAREEVGEVARIISRRYGEQSEKKVDANKDLGEELSDVLFVVLCMANQTGVNLQESFDKKIMLKSKRDKERHLKNPKLNKK